MGALRATGIRKLRGLKNLSWLSAHQRARLAAALVVSKVEKRGVIITEKSPTEAEYVPLSGIARITCRNRKGDRAW